MCKGTIVHLDDLQKNLEECKRFFVDSSGLHGSFDYIPCSNVVDFKDAVDKHRKTLKCLIFDLVGSSSQNELSESDTEFLQYIEEASKSVTLPIFIYSGYLEKIGDRFNNHGTIFKIDKGEDGISKIFDKLDLFSRSGFIDLFCPGGELETEIHSELNQAFIRQFRNDEIEQIIQDVKDTYHEDEKHCRNRCTEIFKRIAVRTLMATLLAPVNEGHSTVNGIEHFFRRCGNPTYWTGDILENNESNSIIILTPRCDCESSSSLLVCDIEHSDRPKKSDAVKNALKDNIKFNHRHYIPPSPMFTKDGYVEYKTHRRIEKTELDDQFHYKISLSENLTNEILAKFGAFFLRTGICTINPEETMTVIRRS